MGFSQKNAQEELPSNAGMPWIKWFYSLKIKEDTYNGPNNQNQLDLVYESVEPQ